VNPTAAPEVFKAVGWGGAVSADGSAFLHFGIKEPLVAAGVAGWLLGYPLFGVELGAALQLFWSQREARGVRVEPDLGLGSVAGILVGVRLLEGGWGVRGTSAPLLLSFVAAQVVALLGMALSSAEWRVREVLVERVERSLGRASRARLEGTQLSGVLISFMKGMAVSGVVVLVLGSGGLDGAIRGAAEVVGEGTLGGFFLLIGCAGVAAGRFLRASKTATILAAGLVAWILVRGVM